MGIWSFRRWQDIIAWIFVSLALVGCDRKPSAKSEANSMTGLPSEKLPEITSEAEEGFVDLVFRLNEHTVLGDGSQRLRVAGLHHGREVGFELILSPTWKGSNLGNLAIKTSKGLVTYRSIGPPSDAFIQAIDELYQTNLKPNSMAQQTAFTGISLEGDPAALKDHAVRIKLFYESGGEDGYAEIYTNIDLAARKVEVREKDGAYRKQVVRSLTAHP
jgi:hypothetical protein